MPNPIKYSTGSETLALKSGNFYIGTGDVGKGPTESTGYYNGTTPPTSGYTIYLNKASQGPSIYTCSNDTDLINITNSIAGQSYTSATECLVYYRGQTDKMCANIDYPSIVTSELVFNLDAGFVPSYPRSGTTWYDLISTSNNGTLINGPTFDLGYEGYLSFDGANDYVQGPTSTNVFSNRSFSVETWIYPFNLGRPQIFFNGNSSFTTQRSFILSLDNNNFAIGFYNNDMSVSGLTYNQWNCLVATYNTTGDLTSAYIDGVFKGSTNVGPFIAASANINIGRWPYPNLGYYSQCYIPIVRIYSRALTSAEVLQNYNATKSRFGL